MPAPLLPPQTRPPLPAAPPRRVKVLTRAAQALPLLLLLAAAGPAAWGTPSAATEPEPAVIATTIATTIATATAGDLIARVNALRRLHGLTPVLANDALAASAADLARHMARTDRFGHDADGRTPAERAHSHGYAHCRVAENIAWEYDSAGFESAQLARQLMQGWIDSPGHRHNLLDAAATDIGVALARGPRSGRWYAVQVFGRPEALRTHFELVNHSRQPVHYRLDGRRYPLAPGERHWHEPCTVPQLSLEGVGGNAGVGAPVTPQDGARLRIDAGRHGPQLSLQGG